MPAIMWPFLRPTAPERAAFPGWNEASDLFPNRGNHCPQRTREESPRSFHPRCTAPFIAVHPEVTYMRKRNLVPAAFLATALMVEGAIAVSRRGQSSVKAHGSFQLDMRDFESKYPSSLGLAGVRGGQGKVWE